MDLSTLVGNTKTEVTRALKKEGFKRFRTPCETKNEASYVGTGFPAYVAVWFDRNGKVTRAKTY